MTGSHSFLMTSIATSRAGENSTSPPRAVKHNALQLVPTDEVLGPVMPDLPLLQNCSLSGRDARVWFEETGADELSTHRQGHAVDVQFDASAGLGLAHKLHSLDHALHGRALLRREQRESWTCP